MKPICYSAPGKVVITGEHAVVYGKPALVCAINKRLSMTFASARMTQYKDVIFPILEKSVIDFLKLRNIFVKKISYSYSVESAIPIGRGLGSSAAYCACISAGLLELFTGKEWKKNDVNICASQMEKYFHTNSSGVDVAASVIGGLLYYRKEFEFLKTISKLSIKIPKHFIDALLLIDTDKPVESTREMVQAVQNNNTEKICNEIEKTTKNIVLSLIEVDKLLFKENIQKNQLLLERLGAVSDKTKKILSDLKDVGIGKVTGAGGIKEGSGYVLFLSEDIKKCAMLLNNKAISYTSFVPSYIGLKKEL